MQGQGWQPGQGWRGPFPRPLAQPPEGPLPVGHYAIQECVYCGRRGPCWVGAGHCVTCLRLGLLASDLGRYGARHLTDAEHRELHQLLCRAVQLLKQSHAHLR